MALSILNNIAGLNAQNQLNINNVNLNRTLLRLSSGKRINSGADDAAGLGIADSLRANVRALDQAVRNANDGISMAQIADGALQEMSNLLTRAVTLAEEAATDTVDTAGRTALQAELDSISTEVLRISSDTNYNGVTLFQKQFGGATTATAKVFVGDLKASSTIDITFVDLSAGIKSLGGDVAAAKLDTTANAILAIGEIKKSLDGVASARATLGAGMNRLQSAVAVLSNQSMNTLAAESTIRDANMAEEIANMTKYQILAQTGIAALSQANASSQSVLTLLRQ